MRLIQKANIIGARIVDVHETYELSDDGLDCRVVYLTVDRGFTFVTPKAGYPWMSLEMPSKAVRLGEVKNQGWLARKGLLPSPTASIEAEIREIKQRLISGIYCGLFDPDLGFHYPWDGTIVFNDGSQASTTSVAPSGTGAAGLYFFPVTSGRCTPLHELVDFFTIPITNETS